MPIALLIPISRMRSVTLTNMMFMMLIPSTNSAITPVPNNKTSMSDARGESQEKLILRISIAKFFTP